jgi:DNA-binding PadR family transcriptional regulator
MASSELDLFILNLVGEGLATPYDLKMKAGLSVGSTLPVLARLEASRLIRGSEEDSRGSRRFTITASGKTALRNGLETVRTSKPTDIDAILRLVHLKASSENAANVQRFLEISAQRLRATALTRLAEAEQGDTDAPDLASASGFRSLKIRCEAARLQGQAEVLTEVAEGLQKKKRTEARAKPTT